jgi:luciferase family oxidoreductase group 1
MPDDNAGILRLSVLDQAPIPEGVTGSQALRNSLDLAKLADGLGYHRYWVAEHHGINSLACASPEALIGPIAATTQNIRVGSGGVMLPHYSPFKVAETFSLFAGLFPGRIDLGVGRAPGSDQVTAVALRRDRERPAPDEFPDLLAEMLAYLWDRMPPEHPFARLADDLPGRPESPDVWLLGSSPQSGLWASEIGLPYTFADFITSGGAAIALRYRQDFKPSEKLDRPHVMVALRVVCAPTDQEALEIAASTQMQTFLREYGRMIQLPSSENALAFLREQNIPLGAKANNRRFIAGSPENVAAEIRAAVAEYGADEVMIVTNTHDHAARRRSYELLAEAFQLTRSTSVPA